MMLLADATGHGIGPALSVSPRSARCSGWPSDWESISSSC
jgi:hypothetical protein